MNIYDFKVKKINGETISLDQYRGKVLLIVNTATGCGFTPQYEGLQDLYDLYKDKGFEVLDFPCNQFLNQAPGTNEEISMFCHSKYHTTFETFAKINVNGSKADPLYRYLKSEISSDTSEEAKKFHKVLASLQQSISGSKIKWNFTKFLVDKEGNVVARFHPTVKPENIKGEILSIL